MIGAVADGKEPVSYTHLDVYKRQLVESLRFAVAGSKYGKLDRGRAAIQDQYEQSRHEDNPLEVAATRQVLFPD